MKNFLLLNIVELQFSEHPRVEFKNSKKNGGKLLVINGIRFFRNRKRNGKQYWKCSYYYKHKCPTIAILNEVSLDIKILHQHRHHNVDKPHSLQAATAMSSNSSPGV